jgi:hypothetical protein
MAIIAKIKTSKWLITGLEEDLYCEGAVAKQSWLLEPPNSNPAVTSLSRIGIVRPAGPLCV